MSFLVIFFNHVHEQCAAFIDELRSYAMRLHTKEQAPKEGQAESPKEKEPWKPTREGYLQFLLESREVYRAFEAITHSGAASFDGKFVNTGLERTSALDADIEYMQKHFEMNPQVTLIDGPGQSYARFLHELSSSSPPAFLCHYYNFYFAHTAGGRMIGAQVSKSVLDGWMGEFYKWDGDVRKLLDSVRGSINNVADSWSEEEKQACIEETPRTFEYSGKLLRCLTSEGVKM